MPALQALWTGAGLEAVEKREISVQRTFAHFDEFWKINLEAPSIAPIIATMESADAEALKRRVRARLHEDTAGRIICDARAHAIKGRRPR